MDEVKVEDKIEESNVVSEIEIKLIKLDNNDLIIAHLTEDCYTEFDLYMIDPVQIQVHQIPYHGRIVETYSLKPWIPLSDDNVLDVPYAKILNISIPSDEVIDKYIDFLTEDDFFEDLTDSVSSSVEEEDLSDIELFSDLSVIPTIH